MNHLQRAWHSVIRKPVKSILLLLVISIISIFLLSGMAGKHVSITAQDSTRQAIGAGILLMGNEADRSRRAETVSKQIGEDKEGTLNGFHQEKIEINGEACWMCWTDNSFETLQIKDIEQIASASGISDYNITTGITAVNPVNFKRVEDSDVDQHSDIGCVSLIGNRDMSMDPNVLSGNVTIKEGRMTGKEDTDVCVISEELATGNHLKTGDKLQFNDYHDKGNSKIQEAEIIGIYQTKQKMAPFMSGDTYRSENVIFTDLRFPEKAEASEDGPLFEKAYFKVGDADRYDAVKEAVKNVDIGWERYDLIDNNGNLDIMSSNFNNLERISEMLIWIVAGTSFVILFLIFTFWMKNRINEIGILLSLGTTKSGILGQMFLEALMIGTAAVLLSFAAAPYVAKVTAGYLAADQEQQAEIQKEMDAGKVTTDYQESELTMTEVNVKITPQMLLLDGTGIIILISISITAAGIPMFKKSPKDILSELS